MYNFKDYYYVLETCCCKELRKNKFHIAKLFVSILLIRKIKPSYILYRVIISFFQLIRKCQFLIAKFLEDIFYLFSLEKKIKRKF